MPQSDPLTVDLDALPLQPQRWMHVLSLILRRHNWQHASKAKGVEIDGEWVGLGHAGLHR